jgi:hypothetical protein
VVRKLAYASNSGSWTWTIPTDETLGTDYTIRVLSIDDPSVYDFSDANFTISQLPTITVTSPNGGEDWQAGTGNDITWTSSGVTGNVRIHLYKGGSVVRKLTATTNSGSWTWNIPSDETLGTDYTVRVLSIDYPDIYDFSDGNFTISAASTLTVTSPNGSEDWQAGTARNIAWNSSLVTGDIRIHLYKGGSVVRKLTCTTNSGSWTWNIPSDEPVGTDYTVRVLSVDDPNVYDFSDANFTISAGSTITVTSPNGSEDWQAGSSHAITWTSSGVTGNVRIHLYKGGSVVRKLTATTNSGSWTWNIPSDETLGTDYTVRVLSIDDPSVYDFSDASFTISAAPTITVTAPNGSEDWQAGTSHDITWTSSGVTGDLRIHLYKGGSVVRKLAYTSDTGSWTWDIPSGETPGTDYTVRVLSIDDPSVYDFSDANFTISAP